MKVFRHIMRGAFREKCWAGRPHAAPACLYEVPGPGRHFEQPNKHIWLQLQGLVNLHIPGAKRFLWKSKRPVIFINYSGTTGRLIWVRAGSLGPPYSHRIVRCHWMGTGGVLVFWVFFSNPFLNFAIEKLKLSFDSFSTQIVSKSRVSDMNAEKN